MSVLAALRLWPCHRGGFRGLWAPAHSLGLRPAWEPPNWQPHHGTPSQSSPSFPRNTENLTPRPSHAGARGGREGLTLNPQLYCFLNPRSPNSQSIPQPSWVGRSCGSPRRRGKYHAGPPQLLHRDTERHHQVFHRRAPAHVAPEDIEGEVCELE